MKCRLPSWSMSWVRMMFGCWRLAAAQLPPLDVLLHLLLVDHPALADELDQFFDRIRNRHRAPCAAGGGAVPPGLPSGGGVNSCRKLEHRHARRKRLRRVPDLWTG